MPPDARERILDAAMQLWSERGYDAATMRELARRLGMSASSLYRHFDGKEAIVLHFYQTLNTAVWEEFQEQGTSGDVGADLVRYLELKLERLAPQSSAVVGLLREAIEPGNRISPLHAGSSGVLDENVGRFASLSTAAGQPAELAQRLARLLWLVHIAVVVFWLHDRSPEKALTHELLERVRGINALLTLLPMLPGAVDGLDLLGRLMTHDEMPAEPPSVAADEQVDVLVLGGGPIGCLTAGFLKRMRPKTRILVVEAAEEVGYKVGESTLSGFCKALRSLGIRQEALRVLFQAKNGLGFSWAEDGARIEHAPEYVLETFDETFQVERRVQDRLILAQTRRLGVQVLQGARAVLARSTFAAEKNRVEVQIGRHTRQIAARWIVDATGPAASIARSLGLWNDDGVRFQSHAVWAAFEDVQPLASRAFTGSTQAPRDEYTWHLCGRSGWFWWIPQNSFEDAPSPNLDQAIEALLREGKLPSREDLTRSGCPQRPRVSVGWVTRSDRDVFGVARDPAAAFEAARRHFPMLDELLEGASLVPDLGGQGPYPARKNMRGHARRVVGDGWLAVGDAAFFIDPLISPGLTAGTATAWQAAKALARDLDGPMSEDRLAGYEAFTHQLHAALERDNQLVWHSFDHPDLLILVQRFQEIAARTHFMEGESSPYGEQDTNVWGILDPSYSEPQKALLAMLHAHAAEVDGQVPVEEQTPEHYAPAVAKAEAILGELLAKHADLTPYLQQNPGVTR